MATLTIDETPADTSEFSAEEMDSLKVGEEMQEAQDNRLAGKYENAQELEKAYIELEKKIGSKSEEEEAAPAAETEDTEEPEQPEQPDGPSVLDKLWDEKDSGFQDETLNELASSNPGELAKAYLQLRASTEAPNLSDKDVDQLKQVAGGEDNYNRVIEWADSNLSSQEKDMYDTVMDRGDKLGCYFAIQALLSRYRDGVGSDGTLLQGKAPSSSSAQFRSQAELVQAMADPRYDRDPAYRRDVQQKLEYSNIDF